MNILNKIIERKKIEVAASKKLLPSELLKHQPYFSRQTLSLKETLLSRSGIIAEFKRKSPSKGFINTTALPQEVAAVYESSGASAVSILTDTEFFGGSLVDLEAARGAVNIPVLRKDFMVDEYQFYEAKAHGADVILLIAACLSPAQVQEFTDLSHLLGLEVLLEIHNEKELGHISKEVDFVGINNRNLKDFKVDLNHSVQLKDQLPQDTFAIAESGIYSVEDYCYLKQKGFHGFLMGEYFMKNGNPGLAFADFIKNIQDEA